MKSQAKSVSVQAQLTSISKPVSVSSFSQRLTNVRNQSGTEAIPGGCGGVGGGWGN